MKKLIATLAIAGAMGVSSLSAQTGDSLSDLSISGTFDFETEYVFRGIQFSQTSFQPSVEFGFPVLGGDLYTGVWTNLPATGTANEVDLYAGYAYPVTDIVTVDAGFIYYWYMNSQAATGNTVPAYIEPYVGASFDVLLSPALYLYYAVDQNGGTNSFSALTIEASIGYSFDLSEYVGAEGISFDVGAYVGYVIPDNSVNAGMQSGFYGGATADLVYAFSENVSSSVGVRYSNYSASGVNNTAGPTASYSRINSQNNVWFGATVGFTY